MRIVKYNPFPPYPPRPDGLSDGEWAKALIYYRQWAALLVYELRDDLLAAKVPQSKVISRSDANQNAGVIDLITIALAQTMASGDRFWDTMPPSKYARETLNAFFGEARTSATANKKIDDAAKMLARRIRDDLVAVGRAPATGAPSAPTAPPPAPSKPVKEAKPRKPAKPRAKKEKEPAPRAPSARPPSGAAPSARPPSGAAPSARPPSGAAPSARPPSGAAPSARPPSGAAPSVPSARPPSGAARRPPSGGTIPDTDEFHEAMEEVIAEGVAALSPSGAPFPSDAPFLSDDDLPYEEERAYYFEEDAPRYEEGAPSRGPRPSGRPPDLSSDIPRVRELSEATLRAEREWFYDDKKASRYDRECPMTRRLKGFWSYRAGVRPPLRPPAEVLKAHEDDILLMVLPFGNMVQVFAKGAITEVFASSREENALHIAARYSNQWRGVNPNGTIAKDAKRSRLNTGIYAAYYTADGISEPVLLGEPITEVLERDPGARGRKVANPAPLSRFLPRTRSTPRLLTLRDEVDAPYAPTIIRIRNPR